VYLAGGATSPPQLAYMVHFPRLSVILSGKDQMEIEQNGAATQLPINRGDAIFVPPNCWNKPAWAGRVRVLTVLFGKQQTGLSLVSQASANQPPVTFKTNFHRPME